MAHKVVIANATSNPDLYHAAVQDLLAGVRALKEGDAAGEKDAARYRWLRDYHIGDAPESVNLMPAKKRGLDAAIDAAMQAMKGEGNGDDE